MSQSDATASFETLASEIAALCADAIEHNRLDDIPDDSLGQVFASVVRRHLDRRGDRLQRDARCRRPRRVRTWRLAGDVAGRPPAQRAQLVFEIAERLKP
jgi:hypothetical protein